MRSPRKCFGGNADLLNVISTDGFFMYGDDIEPDKWNLQKNDTWGLFPGYAKGGGVWPKPQTSPLGKVVSQLRFLALRLWSIPVLGVGLRWRSSMKRHKA